MSKRSRVLALLLCVVLLVSLMPMAALAAESQFADVDSSAWYYDGVKFVSDTGIMNGTGSASFNPNGTMTRAMLVTVLYRAEGSPKATGASSFADVSPDVWYSDAVAWAAENGIVNGYSDVAFGPNDEINREQMATIFYRYAGFKGYDVAKKADLSSFDDADSVSSWAKEAMAWAVAAGLINGTDAGSLNPAGNAARAQAATILMRFDENVADGAIRKTAAADKAETPVEDDKNKNNSSGGSGGGGSSGGGGGSTTRNATGVNVFVDGVTIASNTDIKVGQELTYAIVPSGARGTVVWHIGAQEIETADYTVTSGDLGKTVYAAVKDTEIKSDVYAVSSSMPIDIKATEAASPVAVAGNAVFYKIKEDGSTEEVTISEDAEVVLTIKEAEEGQDNSKKTLVLASMTDLASITDLSAGTMDVKAMTVELSLITESADPSSPDETVIHPVGDTTVKFTAEQLGLEPDADLSLYIWGAYHKNVQGSEEYVEGVVSQDGKTVSFALNGLSVIWLGNVPPRTVSFNTDGGSNLDPVKVKFGEKVDTTKLVKPEKEGYLFCGWNFDLANTPIIQDITINAKWVAGEQMPVSQYRLAAKNSAENVSEVTNEAGKATILVDAEAQIPEGAAYTLEITTPEGAAKYVMSADAVSAAESEEYTNVSGAISKEFAIKTGDKINAGKTDIYVKWIASDGKVIGLQGLTVIIDDGSGDAEKTLVTRSINRGVGTFEGYLIDKEGVQPDYVGYINGNVNGSLTDGYYLYSYVNFDSGYIFDEAPIDIDDYDTVRLVFTPFEGETYSGKAISAAAYIYDENGKKDLSVAAKLGNDGKITIETSRLAQNVDYFYVDVTVGDVTQEIYVDILRREGVDDNKNKSIEANTWAEVLTALNQNYDEERVSIHYLGEEDVVVSNSLTVPAKYYINVAKAANFTVASGGTVKLMSGDGQAAVIYGQNMTFTVKNGGVLTCEDRKTAGNHWVVAIRAKNVTIESGGKITIPENTYLEVNSGYTADSGDFRLEAGATIECANHLNLQRFRKNYIAGTINLMGSARSGGYIYFYGETEISGSVNVVGGSNYVRAYFYGDTKLTSTGKITANNTNRNSGIFIAAPFTNEGTIDIISGNFDLANLSYSAYNKGSIKISSGMAAIIRGTKFINNGTITGSGTLNAVLGDDITAYDNGIVFVEVAYDKWVPGNYSRYKFIKDPEKTIKVTLYKGELVNENGGTCTVTVNTEDFPE